MPQPRCPPRSSGSASDGVAITRMRPYIRAMRRLIPLLALLAVAVPAAAQRADRATPGYVRVRLETALGNIGMQGS